MPILIDTSILARLANAADAQHSIAANAIAHLHNQEEVLCITAQNMVEFRNMATRPVLYNGIGISCQDCETLIEGFEKKFVLIPESPAIYPAWKSIVASLGIIGKQVHDARLVAVCHVHGVSHLLTFNVGHFSRLAAFGPGLTIVDPATV